MLCASYEKDPKHTSDIVCNKYKVKGHRKADCPNGTFAGMDVRLKEGDKDDKDTKEKMKKTP